MSDERQRGMQFFGDVFGGQQESALGEHLVSSEFGKECATWAADFAFGTVWTREGLDRKTRSCLTLALLTALRAENELPMHVRAARRNGLTPAEIKEVFLHAAVYAGVPAANSAFAIAQRTLAEEG